MKGIILFVTGCIIFSVISFFYINTYIYNNKQTSPTRLTAPYRGTLSGTFVCLPRKEKGEVQTMECTYGIKTDAGEYYVLDLSLMSQTPPSITSGDHFTANGTITPIEFISTNQWKKYPVVGIFSVTDSVKKF